MGQILDIVPNHMGVLEADNAWWLDVLEHGPAAARADLRHRVDPPQPEMDGRVLLPVLGEHYGDVLEPGEISCTSTPKGEFGLRYYDHRFPVDPAATPSCSALPALPARDDSEATPRLVAALLDSFARLPPRDDADEDARRARARSRRLQAAARPAWRAPRVARPLDRGLRAAPERPAGRPRASTRWTQLVAAQAYRLADWRVASDDVNYRRFFDVNTLAGLRMERPEVFEATHRKVLQLAAGRACSTACASTTPTG